MKKTHIWNKPAVNPVQSVYDYVGGQIAVLIPRFNLEDWRSEILQTYRDICQDSLAFPLGKSPSGASRINQDGTPFQYAVTLGLPLRALQFISEAGPVGATGGNLSGAERLRINRECMQTVAGRLQAGEALAGVGPLLDVLAPAANVDLLADPGGAFWTGVAFCAGQRPSIRIYTNASWGSEGERWRRLRYFASTFEMGEAWEEMEQQLAPGMKPLGTAITLSGKEPPSGRIYLTTYGKRAGYFEALAEKVSGPGFRDILEQFNRCVLGDDYIYPTQTAVCSFGIGSGAGFDFKFELCAHCLFTNDVQALTRLHAWFARAAIDMADYNDLLGILAEGSLSSSAAELHAYVGVGLKRGHPYSTIYLKPRLIPVRARGVSSDGD